MENFELQRYITIGQYLPRESVVHHLDPRAKLLAFILVVAAITFTQSYEGNLVLVAACLLVVALSQIPIRYALSGLRLAIPFLIAIALLQLLFFGKGFAPNSPVIFHWGFVYVTQAVVRLVVISVLRFLELLLLTSVLTFSTTTTQLTHGVEELLSPFKRIGVPAHELALILTIALRFVPTFAREMEKVMKAQASRGAQYGGGGLFSWVQRTRSMLPLIIPLFLIALERAEELIVAMEARGYVPGRERTRLVELKAHWLDYAAVGVCLVFAVLMLVVPFRY